MRVIMLGTGGAIPTLSRSLPSTALKREGEILLFDCGEGTQLQMKKAGLSIMKLSAIFISHLHGDHLTGLPGLLMTLVHLSRKESLYIFGPPGINAYIDSTKNCIGFSPEYDITVEETTGGRIYEGSGYRVEALPVDHTIFTLAYVFEEEKRPGRFYVEKAKKLGIPEGPLFNRLQKGKDVELNDGRIVHPEDVLGNPRRGRKIVYAVDTRPCQVVADSSKGADILIHDGMFSDQLREEADQKGHSTVVQAARIARKAGVSRLVLSHISPRYSETDALLNEALVIYPSTILADDLSEFEIPLPE